MEKNTLNCYAINSHNNYTIIFYPKKYIYNNFLGAHSTSVNVLF